MKSLPTRVAKYSSVCWSWTEGRIPPKSAPQLLFATYRMDHWTFRSVWLKRELNNNGGGEFCSFFVTQNSKSPNPRPSWLPSFWSWRNVPTNEMSNALKKACKWPILIKFENENICSTIPETLVAMIMHAVPRITN